MKKDKISTQFPSIFRFITEKHFYKTFEKSRFRLTRQTKFKKKVVFSGVIFMIFVIIVLSLGIAVYSIRVYRYYMIAGQVAAKRQSLRDKVSFWQSIEDKYDGYKDAYFQMALLEYQLSEFKKAKDDNQKALLLDPNFNDAKKLEVFLDKKIN